MRLIDADELKKALAEMWYEKDMRITVLSVADLIDEAPTIEPYKSADQNVADVPIDDLISREEALDVVCKELQSQEENRIPYDSYDSGTCYGLKIARELLLALPSADRPKGEWIDREDTADIFFLYRYECSVCGGKNVFNSSYCPNCGAHMR